MIYWLIVAFSAMLFRSYGWEAVAPTNMCDDTFYAVYDIFGSVAILCATKAAGYGRSLKNRLFIDLILAFMWADVFDRVIGINYTVWRDWLILPIWAVFTALVYFKHTYIPPQYER